MYSRYKFLNCIEVPVQWLSKRSYVDRWCKIEVRRLPIESESTFSNSSLARKHFWLMGRSSQVLRQINSVQKASLYRHTYSYTCIITTNTLLHLYTNNSTEILLCRFKKIPKMQFNEHFFRLVITIVNQKSKIEVLVVALWWCIQITRLRAGKKYLSRGISCLYYTI